MKIIKFISILVHEVKILSIEIQIIVPNDI